MLTGAEVRDQQPLDSALTCSICKKLVWDAVRTPCCDTAFCEECITTHLVERAFECPVCESKVASLDKLNVDEDLRNRVKVYIDGEIERSRKEEKEEKDGEDGATDGINGAAEVKGEDGESEQVKGEEGSLPPDGTPDGPNQPPQANGSDNTNGHTTSTPAPGMDFDATRMQEMLNPAVMQQYLSQVCRLPSTRGGPWGFLAC